MAFVATTFKLDLTPGAARQVLYTSQGDIGRPFEADLYWNGSPWTATGTTASIRGKKPDDTVFDYTATVSGTAVTFETKEQMTIISGPVECELVFTNDGDIIASANFLLIVEASPYDPNAISESEVQGLNAMIQAATPEAVDDWFETEAPSSAVFADAVNDATDAYLDENGVVIDYEDIANKPDFGSEINFLNENVLKYDTLSPRATVNGWELVGNGLCRTNSNAQILKYDISDFEYVHLVLSADNPGVYQFQNAESVPSSNSNNYLVGEPVNFETDAVVKVPEGALRLIVSQNIGNSTNTVESAKSLEIKERLKFLETLNIKLESGTYSDHNGVIKSPRTDRIRTVRPIPIKQFESITAPEGYTIWVFPLDENYTIVSWPQNVRWDWKTTLPLADLPSNTRYLNFSIKNASNASADLTNLVDEIQAGLIVKLYGEPDGDENEAERLKEFKTAYYPYTVQNFGSGWNSRVNILHVSDNHVGSTSPNKNFKESVSVGNTLKLEDTLQAVVNTGDMTNGMLMTKAAWLEQYISWAGMMSKTTVPYVALLGNHDANNSSDQDPVNVPTNKERWDNAFSTIASKTPAIVWGDAENYREYCYLDVTKGGRTVRIIMLDMFDRPDYDGTNTDYIVTAVYSQKQINWLANTALNVPDGYGVIICSHYPIAPARQTWSEEYPNSDGGFAQGWKMIPEIVDAWQRRTTISKTFEDTVGDQNIVANYNFSSVPSGAAFVCYLVGHLHYKGAYQVKEENGVSFNQLMLCEDSSGQNGVAINRVYKRWGTIADNAFSCISVDLDEMKVYRTSYGVYKKCSDPTVTQTQVFDILTV